MIGDDCAIRVLDERAALQAGSFSTRGICVEIHRELGNGDDEVICKGAFVVELGRPEIPFSREKDYEVSCKGIILPHYYYADFVVWDKILFEVKAVEKLTDSHIKQVLNYLAASKLHVGLLVNFAGDPLHWKRVVLCRKAFVTQRAKALRSIGANS